LPRTCLQALAALPPPDSAAVAMQQTAADYHTQEEMAQVSCTVPVVLLVVTLAVHCAGCAPAGACCLPPLLHCAAKTKKLRHLIIAVPESKAEGGSEAGEQGSSNSAQTNLNRF